MSRYDLMMLKMTQFMVKMKYKIELKRLTLYNVSIEDKIWLNFKIQGREGS